jgi:hypothetical protein
VDGRGKPGHDSLDILNLPPAAALGVAAAKQQAARVLAIANTKGMACELRRYASSSTARHSEICAQERLALCCDRCIAAAQFG